MRRTSTFQRKILALSLFIAILPFMISAGEPSAGCGGTKVEKSIVVGLQLAFNAAGPTIAAFEEAKKITPQQGQDLRNDFDTFNSDVTILARATTTQGRIDAIEVLVDDFIAAGPHFNLPDIEANAKFQLVYTLAKAAIRSAELYFGVEQPKLTTVVTVGPVAKGKTAKVVDMNRKPTAEEVKAQVDVLKAELENR